VARQRTIVQSLTRANRSLARLHRQAAGNPIIQLIEGEVGTLISQAQDSLTEMNAIISHAAPASR
jgi:hypothetical protein